MKLTKNYKFKKPEPLDTVNIEDINESFDNLDENLYKLENTFENLLINAGSSNAEVVAARVDKTGKSYKTVGERINVVDSQLEQINDNLNGNTNYNKGIFTIIDDDGLASFMDRWKPIADAQGIKISAAIMTDAVGVTTFLSLSQLKQLKQEGYDLLSHARNSINMDTASLEQIEDYWSRSKEYFIANGLGDDLALVYPGGLFNVTNENKIKDIKNITRKHYKYGRDALASSKAINKLPVDSYEILRRNFNTKTDNLNSIKANIDDAYTNNKWFILLTHIGDDRYWDSTTSPTVLNSVIDYVKNLNMPILSFREAEKLVGNSISHGDSRTDNFNFICKNGAAWSRSQRSLIETMTTTSMDALIEEYPKKTIHRQQIPYNLDTFLNKGGVLETYRGDTNFSYQIYYVAQSMEIHKRYYNDATRTWGVWSGTKQDLILENGWGGTLKISIDGNKMVTLEGNLTVGTNTSTIISSIPIGYRVPQTMIIPVSRVSTNTVSMALGLYTTGSIITTSASSNGLTAGETIQFYISYKAV